MIRTDRLLPQPPSCSLTTLGNDVGTTTLLLEICLHTLDARIKGLLDDVHHVITRREFELFDEMYCENSRSGLIPGTARGVYHVHIEVIDVATVRVQMVKGVCIPDGRKRIQLVNRELLANSEKSLSLVHSKERSELSSDLTLRVQGFHENSLLKDEQ